MRPHVTMLLSMLLACGSVGDSSDASVDATPDAHVYTCAVQDAGLNAAYFSDASSPDCPAQWSDLTHDGGIPNACSIEGLLCIYAEGQTVCANNGSAGLRWNSMGRSVGCDVPPPTQCTPCSLTPGYVCEYLNGEFGTPGFVTDFCCDGNIHEWDLRPDGGCPNGNVCGTIHASDYDQSCTTAADCAPVTEGDLCTMACTDCINAFVNKNVLAQYESDFESKLSIPRNCPCPEGPSPVCDAGVCALPY